MRLTERDKKLLLMLACFVIVTGFGVFVFRPLISNYVELGDRLLLLETQKEEMDEQIKQGRGLEQRRNELADLLRVSTREFYPMLESEEVDKEITGIVLSCGMQALTLNIAMPQEGLAITPYMPDISEEEESAEVTDSRSYIYAPVVTFTASGSEAQVEELIDKLTREYPAIRVRSYSRQAQGSYGYEENITGLELLSLELELYMCEHSLSGQEERP